MEKIVFTNISEKITLIVYYGIKLEWRRKNTRSAVLEMKVEFSFV
jgi:hypothetical protein